MAYNAQNETREELAVIEKNSRGDCVAVSKITKDDKVSYDIRNMYTDDNDELRYTSKGVRMSDDMTKEVVLAILKSLSQEDLEEVLGGLPSNVVD